MKQKMWLKSAAYIALSIICGVASSAENISLEEAQKFVTRAFPSVKVSAITPTPLPELYEITVNGKPFYLSKDGNFMLSGKIRQTAVSESAAKQAHDKKELTDEQAQQHISQEIPDIKVDRVKPAPLAGFYEIVGNGRIFYLSHDGRFWGTEMYHLPDAVNLTRQSYGVLRLDAMKTIKEEQVLSYIPKQQKYAVYIFTDVNCAYCRKLHSQIDEMLALGIRVNYLLFDNLGRDSYIQAVKVWCSKNRHQAFDLIKKGEAVDPQADCDHPIDRNRNLARLVEVKQTPAFLLSNGRLINRYLSPEVLLEEIKEAGSS